MKPKDLKSPYCWDERRPHLADGVLFVPAYFDRHEEFPFPGWESEQVFGRRAPVMVELCSGNGRWIIDRAKAAPELNWVAVEIRFDRVRKIWSKARNEGLSNLFVVCGEAMLTCDSYFPSASVSELFVNFPDPWPKKRHAKNRLVKEGFAERVDRILTPEGKVTLVTDDVDYSDQMVEVMGAAKAFLSALPIPHFVHEWPGYGSSWFEELWRQKGRAIRYHCFHKQGGLEWA